MKTTVKEIRAMLETLPDNMPVEFSPISMAWMGTSGSMRFDDMHFFNEDGQVALPSEKDVHLEVFLTEDEREHV